MSSFSSTQSNKKKIPTDLLVIDFFQKNSKIIVSMIVGFFSILYLYPESPHLQLFQALEQISNVPGHNQQANHTVAIGWNTNLDLIVDAVELMKKLGVKANIENPKDHNKIGTMAELEEILAYYMEKSAAAERFVSEEKLFKQILNSAQSLSSMQQQTGGNAALMANQFAKEGHNVILGGPVGSKLQNLLNSNITLVPKEKLKTDDEVHLILEYSPQSTWGVIKPIRSNRFIITRDEKNSNLFGMEEFFESISTLEVMPKILVASGINILEIKSAEKRTKRLSALVQRFRDFNSSIPIHLEFASIGEPGFLKETALTLFSEVDSIGMNEQELASLYDVLGGTFNETITKDSLNSKVPHPKSVIHALRFLMEKFVVKKEKKQGRGLQRIHYHSYAYHIVAEQFFEDDSSSRLFKTSKAAAARGSVTATKTACGIQGEMNLSEKDVFLLAPKELSVVTAIGESTIVIDDVNPVAQWQEVVSYNEKSQSRKPNLSIEFSFAPVLICKEPKTTVGLGDAISASALSFSL